MPNKCGGTTIFMMECREFTLFTRRKNKEFMVKGQNLWKTRILK